MQAFKLVNAGFVDKVIVFDSLPESFYKNVKTKAPDGFPRSWGRWLGEIGSTRTVFKTETSVDLARNWKFTNTPIGKEPCFFVLEYTDLNADKEAWRRICDYLKTNCDETVRLKEKIEDMAVQLAPDSYKPLSIEYEDIPVISVSAVIELATPELIREGETILVEPVIKKKAGRPKKVAVEA